MIYCKKLLEMSLVHNSGVAGGVGKNKSVEQTVEFIACDRQCQSNCSVERLTAQVFEGALTLFIFTAQVHSVEERLRGS